MTDARPTGAPTDAPVRVLVVDAANVVGARPDGWWRDRVAAADRLLDALSAFVDPGAAPHDPDGAVPHDDDADLAGRHVVVVLEGRASAASPSGRPALEILRAPADGDAAIVDVVARALGGGGAGPRADVVVVTSDRELRGRVEALGARTVGAGRLRDALDADAPGPGRVSPARIGPRTPSRPRGPGRSPRRRGGGTSS